MDGWLLIFVLIVSFAITIGVVLYILDKREKSNDDTTKTTEIQYVLTPSTYNGWNNYYGWNYGKRHGYRRRYW